MPVQTAQTLLPCPIHLHLNQHSQDLYSFSPCTYPTAYIAHLLEHEKFLETSEARGSFTFLFEPFFSTYVAKILPSLTDPGSRLKTGLQASETGFDLLIDQLKQSIRVDTCYFGLSLVGWLQGLVSDLLR